MDDEGDKGVDGVSKDVDARRRGRGVSRTWMARATRTTIHCPIVCFSSSSSEEKETKGDEDEEERAPRTTIDG